MLLFSNNWKISKATLTKNRVSKNAAACFVIILLSINVLRATFDNITFKKNKNTVFVDGKVCN